MRIVGGEWSGRRIQAPPGRLTRPTTDRVREAWMSAIAPEIPDATVLDLFAGSGALGIEALSRGARHVTFVEQAPRTVEVLRKNLNALSAAETTYAIVRADAVRFVEKSRRLAFDIALADPPYRAGHATDLARIFASTPFARLLCIEHAPDEPLETGAIWQRRYGDTALTFFRGDDD